MISAPARALDRRFDVEALHWFTTRRCARHQAAMATLIGHLAVHGPTAQSGLTALFRLDRTHHFLRAPRTIMPRLHEPQVTGALRDYLMDPASRLRRTQAIFDAVLGSEAIQLTAADPAVAEERGGPRDRAQRIDLMLRATAQDGTPRCLAIEAKFEHRLSKDQPARYRRSTLHHLRAMPGGAAAPDDCACLVVIAPLLREQDAILLNKDRIGGKTPAWRFLTWRRFLLRIEGSLPDDNRDNDFRGLLRIIWERCGDR